MWELNHKEGWATKNWCFWAVVLEKTLESPLDCKEIQPVHPKGNQSWVFIERTDAEAETWILWSPDVKSQLTGKDPDAGKKWRQEKGITEDETVGWHHRPNGHEFEQALGDSEGQGSLACCSPGVAKSRTRLRDWTATTERFLQGTWPYSLKWLQSPSAVSCDAGEPQDRPKALGKFWFHPPIQGEKTLYESYRNQLLALEMVPKGAFDADWIKVQKPKSSFFEKFQPQ